MDSSFGIDLRWTAPLLVVALFLAAELGYRAGRHLAPRIDAELRGQIGAVEASALGLLGLLLAFTFSMAAERYETRRQLVLEEANAIGTAWLRCDLLPEESRAEAKDLLASYVDARLAFYEAGEDQARLDVAVHEAEGIQTSVWAIAVSAMRAEPGNVALASVVPALNTVIDLHEARLTALDNHVPDLVIGLLGFAAIASIASLGCNFGLLGRRALHAIVLLVALLSSIVIVILDLDRPRGGLVRVSQQAMRDLKDEIEAGPTHP